MSNGFYRAFEEKHRGSRELIKTRMRAYLPFVEPLAAFDKGAQSADLGCGRGEWLELMAETGFTPRGVDLDEEMLNGCMAAGLAVERADILDFLATLPNESQAVVSAFHVVEHIGFEQLQTVVAEAHRVLKPGGLLIMETPNPENIVVGTCSFYLDPTHQRPIPPDLLSFLPEYYGFLRVKTIRLQESQAVAQSGELTLHDVLNGVSPDYAVIAQKAAAPEVLQRSDSAFEHEHGLSLATLTARYSAQLKIKTEEMKAQAERAEAQAERAEAQARQAEAKAEHAEAQARQAQAKAEHAGAQARQAETKANHAEAQAQQSHHALNAIFNSRSWRVSAPLRWCRMQSNLLRQRGLLARTKALVKKIARPLVRQCIAFTDARPRLRSRIVALTQRLGLYRPLRLVYRRLSGRNQVMSSWPGHADGTNQWDDLSQLTPTARELYAELKAAFQNKKKPR